MGGPGRRTRRGAAIADLVAGDGAVADVGRRRPGDRHVGAAWCCDQIRRRVRRPVGRDVVGGEDRTDEHPFAERLGVAGPDLEPVDGAVDEPGYGLGGRGRVAAAHRVPQAGPLRARVADVVAGDVAASAVGVGHGRPAQRDPAVAGLGCESGGFGRRLGQRGCVDLLAPRAGRPEGRAVGPQARQEPPVEKREGDVVAGSALPGCQLVRERSICTGAEEVADVAHPDRGAVGPQPGGRRVAVRPEGVDVLGAVALAG